MFICAAGCGCISSILATIHDWTLSVSETTRVVLQRWCSLCSWRCPTMFHFASSESSAGNRFSGRAYAGVVLPADQSIAYQQIEKRIRPLQVRLCVVFGIVVSFQMSG